MIKTRPGIYTWADGDYYIGEYKDGEMHGQGTIIWADGENARWFNKGMMTSQGVYT